MRNALDVLTHVKGEKYTEYRMMWDEASHMRLETKFPLHVDIDITDSCNKRCSMCLQWKKPGFSYQKMDERLFNNILNEITVNGGMSVNIGTNTEPIVYPSYFIDMMHTMKGYSFTDSFIHTNGMNMGGDIAQCILDSGVSNLVFSFGMLENFNEINRVIKNVLYFKAFQDSHGSELPVIRLDVMPTGDNQMMVEHVLSKLEPVVDVVNLQNIGDYNDILKDMPGMEKVVWYCTDTWKRLYVNSYGHMYQCCAFPEISKHLYLGSYSSLRNKGVEFPIGMMWNGVLAKDHRQKIRKKHMSPCNVCMSKFYRYGDKK